MCTESNKKKKNEKSEKKKQIDAYEAMNEIYN